MLKLSDSEVILASMTPEEAREYNQGNKENTLIYRAAKAKAKRFLEEEKKQKKVLQYINDKNIIHADKKASPAEMEAAIRRENIRDKNLEKYFIEDKPKKVAKIPVIPPKPDLVNGHSDWNTEDWLESVNPGGWVDDKRSGILEFELADEYWQTQFENYQNNGGQLNYQQWMQQQMNKKISREIDKRVKDKQRTEGIAQILGIPGNKI